MNELLNPNVAGKLITMSAKFDQQIAYITDLHLMHRFQVNGCKTAADRYQTIKDLVQSILVGPGKVVLIGGDTSTNFNYFREFVRELNRCTKDQTINPSEYFFILGNHELWPLQNGWTSYGAALKTYQDLFKYTPHCHLLQNSLWYCRYTFPNKEWYEITSEELQQMSVKSLQKKIKGAWAVILGGIGFSGQCQSFNADDGIYRGTVDRKLEQCESARFLRIYQKVQEAHDNENLIVLTHMPLEDWAGSSVLPDPTIYYVSGHTHKNYYKFDKQTKIFADNQIGYTQKTVYLKFLPTRLEYDPFKNYVDGIYEITEPQYLDFLTGKGHRTTCCYHFDVIYMIKREKYYAFFVRGAKGNLMILYGGAVKKVVMQDLQYYYDNLLTFVHNIDISSYYEYQQQISEIIKQAGGMGYIHGAIIDIDSTSHIYINPLDGTVVPYYATTMVDKYVYSDLLTLVQNRVPTLYNNLKALLPTILSSNPASIDKATYTPDTQMYKYSRLMLKFQKIFESNVVGCWSDEVLTTPNPSLPTAEPLLLEQSQS